MLVLTGFTRFPVPARVGQVSAVGDSEPETVVRWFCSAPRISHGLYAVCLTWKDAGRCFPKSWG